MTEISLIVTLNNQFNSTQLNKDWNLDSDNKSDTDIHKDTTMIHKRI